jgi:L-fuconolactonase
MNIIDTHQHFWKYNSTDFGWVTDNMRILRKDYLPDELEVILKNNQVNGCIAVQADQSETETNYLLELAASNSFISGVVGWIDLRNPYLDGRLQHYKQFTKLKGFRHILQSEEPAFMLQDDFLQGINLLQKYNFTYDILIYPKHLAAALELVKHFPLQSFVIDHMAKPDVNNKEIDEWEKGIRAISNYANVSCKLSGLVTEANWQTWTNQDLVPYINTIVQAFGIDRIMFGSDWPVCLLASVYDRWLSVVKDFFSEYPIEDQEKIFSQNAINFYHL